MTLAWVMLGAAVGAPLRLVLASRYDGRWPWGTFAVNVAGSFLLGVFSRLALDAETMALLGAGFCGGFTTYSAFAVQAHDLPRARAVAYVALTTTCGVGAAALGWLLAQA